MKPTVLIVDDRIENLKILAKILDEDCQVETCTSGGDALARLGQAPLPQLVLLDIIMPGIDGFDVLRAMKSDAALRHIPVVCITTGDTEQQALALGAADYIAKPFEPQIVRLRVRNHILLKRHMDDLESLVAEKMAQTIHTRDNMLVVLADIIEYRSIESGSHVKRVAQYTQVLLVQLMDGSEYADEVRRIGLDVIVKAVPMHDVGKIGIPDSILLKPGKLTSEEYDLMKTHTTIGKTIIDSILSTAAEHSDFLRHCSDIAYYHHERYDGKGYPMGLAGRNIPLSARIMAVADVYDALVTKRVYKNAFLHETAVNMIVREAGTQFDPVVVQAFMRVNERCRTIANNTFAQYA